MCHSTTGAEEPIGAHGGVDCSRRRLRVLELGSPTTRSEVQVGACHGEFYKNKLQRGFPTPPSSRFDTRREGGTSLCKLSPLIIGGEGGTVLCKLSPLIIGGERRG
ncbi:unnamed protein product [Linum trigynum]|uniref:Uncharacterized protein n=1 Tax=Linum trigynum TaxID=586398 RepID=A0AAV2CUN3_9ROSI